MSDTEMTFLSCWLFSPHDAEPKTPAREDWCFFKNMPTADEKRIPYRHSFPVSCRRFLIAIAGLTLTIALVST